MGKKFKWEVSEKTNRRGKDRLNQYRNRPARGKWGMKEDCGRAQGKNVKTGNTQKVQTERWQRERKPRRVPLALAMLGMIRAGGVAGAQIAMGHYKKQERSLAMT